MREFAVIALWFLSATSMAAGQAPGAASLGAASLRTEGLNYADDLARLYVGEFARVGFGRNGTEFSILLSQYMHAFSRHCASALPANKVEITTQECARESWTVNGYGVEQPGSRRCVSYRTVGTGRFADPEVYKLHLQLDAAAAQVMMQGVFGNGRPGGDPASGMRRMTDIAVYAKSDMPKLLQANECGGPALKRLQANMLLFGQGKDPIVLPGGAAALAERAAPAEGPRKEQNYARLLDDLVAEQSQAWMMNRYQKGSVRAASVSRDGQGGAREIVASYGYLGMGKPYTGKLRVTFADGAPQCLYFSDLPESCRVPSPRIISAYRKNEYALEPGANPASRVATADTPAPAAEPRPAEVAAPATAPATAPQTAPPSARPEPAADPVPQPERENQAARREAALPEPAQRDAAQPSRAAAAQDGRAASNERICSSLKANIDRARAAAAGGPPQNAQRADAQVARAEQLYAQRCGR